MFSHGSLRPDLHCRMLVVPLILRRTLSCTTSSIIRPRSRHDCFIFTFLWNCIELIHAALQFSLAECLHRKPFKQPDCDNAIVHAALKFSLAACLHWKCTHISFWCIVKHLNNTIIYIIQSNKSKINKKNCKKIFNLTYRFNRSTLFYCAC